jgi:WD40 repeat protein
MCRAWLVPADGGPCRTVVPPFERQQLEQGAVSPSGARVASAYFGAEGPRTLYVFDVDTGAVKTLALPEPEKPTPYDGVWSLAFLDEQTLLTMGRGGIRRWDLATGTHQLVEEAGGHTAMRVSRAAGVAVTWAYGCDLARPVRLVDLATGTSRPLEAFGDVFSIDLDPSGEVLATCSRDGTIRVGRLSGPEPHLLLGHVGNVFSVAISPDLRWVASAGEDDTLRLWPMPDLGKPPLHTLPYGELLAKLRSLTNLRAVRDQASPGGWKVEVGPFPGWATVPTW